MEIGFTLSSGETNKILRLLGKEKGDLLRYREHFDSEDHEMAALLTRIEGELSRPAFRDEENDLYDYVMDVSKIGDLSWMVEMRAKEKEGQGRAKVANVLFCIKDKLDVALASSEKLDEIIGVSPFITLQLYLHDARFVLSALEDDYRKVKASKNRTEEERHLVRAYETIERVVAEMIPDECSE